MPRIGSCSLRRQSRFGGNFKDVLALNLTVSRSAQDTYAHTCVPVSGMIVKRTMSSLRRTQATFPRDEREAVNSVYSLELAVELENKRRHTRESLDVLHGGFEPHLVIAPNACRSSVGDTRLSCLDAKVRVRLILYVDYHFLFLNFFSFLTSHHTRHHHSRLKNTHPIYHTSARHVPVYSQPTIFIKSRSPTRPGSQR